MRGKEWCQTDIDFLVRNYKTMTCEEIAKDLNRTIRSVQYKYMELGLKRDKKIQ